MTDKIVVLSTCGSEEEARKLAHGIVEASVAACVNIVPGIRSIYQWKGKVEDDSEWLLVIKSRRDMLPRLVALLEKMHSYDVPEVVALPIVDGADSYLGWIDRELGPAE